MNTNDWLATLYKHHKDWIGIVRSFGESIYAEDIVQEMYLRLDKYGDKEKFIVNGEVNKGFIWIVLKNYHISYQKQKSKYKKIGLESIKEQDASYIEIERYICREVIEQKIEAEMNTWHWYDKKLFTIYRNGDKSMRQLSKETTISTDSIFNTIKKCKQRIREAVGEDYEDYLNSDYEMVI